MKIQNLEISEVMQPYVIYMISLAVGLIPAYIFNQYLTSFSDNFIFVLIGVVIPILYINKMGNSIGVCFFTQWLIMSATGATVIFYLSHEITISSLSFSPFISNLTAMTVTLISLELGTRFALS